MNGVIPRTSHIVFMVCTETGSPPWNSTFRLSFLTSLKLASNPEPHESSQHMQLLTFRFNEENSAWIYSFMLRGSVREYVCCAFILGSLL